jgi:hypothetical protein
VLSAEGMAPIFYHSNRRPAKNCTIPHIPHFRTRASWYNTTTSIQKGGSMASRVRWLLTLLLVTLVLESCGETITPTPTIELARYLNDVIKFSPDPPITNKGTAVSVSVQISNTDTQPHEFNAQANFYTVPLNAIGSDPAQYIVTGGYTHVALSAGEARTIIITATNPLSAPILSVNFNTVGK